MPRELFRQYRRSLIYENPYSDAELVSKMKNLNSKELFDFYNNQFHRLFSENKNEIEFLNNVMAAANKDNEPEIALRMVFKLLQQFRLYCITFYWAGSWSTLAEQWET